MKLKFKGKEEKYEQEQEGEKRGKYKCNVCWKNLIHIYIKSRRPV
jgi:hypothetical protein